MTRLFRTCSARRSPEQQRRDSALVLGSSLFSTFLLLAVALFA